MPHPRWIARPEEAGVRLDKYLAAPGRLGSRARAVEALARGKVFINDREASPRDAGSRVRTGDAIRYWIDRPGSARRPVSLGDRRDLAILYEDESLVVLNKPPGVLAVPLESQNAARSVYEELKAYLRKRRRPRPLVIHRIDRDTSGLVIFAKHARAQEQLREQFKRRTPQRVYLAVVYGRPTPPSGIWRDRLNWDRKALIQKETGPRDPAGKDAVSQYRVVEWLKDSSLLEVQLVTGRRNQIRIQAGLHGHTLVGERRYVFGPQPLRTIAFSRQALHAHRLSFTHPTNGRMMTFEAPVPADLGQLIASLRLS